MKNNKLKKLRRKVRIKKREKEKDTQLHTFSLTFPHKTIEAHRDGKKNSFHPQIVRYSNIKFTMNKK